MKGLDAFQVDIGVVGYIAPQPQLRIPDHSNLDHQID